MQSELQKLGYYSGATDGEFGRLTELAVRAIQTEFQLTSDGVVGSATRNVLDSLRGHWETGPRNSPEYEVPPES